MNLQEFIKETLVQIASGIEGAAAELKGSKAIINPRNVQTGAGDDTRLWVLRHADQIFQGRSKG